MKAKTRIALVANSAWYIYNFRLGLIKSLQDDGFNVVVITPVDDFINHIYELDIAYFPLYKLARKSKNPFNELQLYQEFMRVYKEAKPELVIQYTIKPNIYGGMAANKLGIKILSVIPGLGHAFAVSSMLRTISKILYKKSLKFSSKVIFENQSDADLFVRQKLIIQDQAVTFKGCGVDTSHFVPMQANRRHDGRVFLYMGRLILEKGIKEFVEASRTLAKRNNKIQFWIIGHIDAENPSAVPKDEFLQWIKHPQIKYLGFKDDVRQIIADCDCVVLPTYYPEGIPRVLQEAMSMEKTIITTDTNGCREAVDEGQNGFLVQPRSIVDLTAKMEEVLRLTDAELMEMGRRGREKAILEFDESISILQYMTLVKEALL